VIIKLALLIVAAATNLALSVFILLKNPRMLVNRAFSLFAFLVSLWVFSNFMAEGAPDGETALLWVRAAQAVTSLMAVSLLILVTVFPLGRTLCIDVEMRVFLSLAVFFFILSWTPLVMRSVTMEAWGVRDHPGPLLFLFTAYLVACIGRSMWKLYRKVTRTRGLEKLQIQYLVLGISLTAISAITTILLLPILLGSSNLAGYGSSFSIILAAFVAHTIVRYRLLKMHLVIRRGVVYALSLGLAVIGFILLLSGLQIVLRHPFGPGPMVSTSAAALAVTVLFQPLRRSIQRLFDRYFYREARNYSTVILNVSKSLSSILDLEKLTGYLYGILTDLMHPDHVCIYLRSSQHGVFELQSSRTPSAPGNGPPESIWENDSIISQLSAGRDLMVLEELLREHSDGSIEAVVSEMKALGIDVAVPVVLKDSLTAVILMGPLLSGDIYADDDLGFLVTLANQSAVAINNAQLYDEIRRVRDYNVSILARMESGVITVDRRNTIVFCNPAATAILISDGSGMIGRNLADFDPTLAAMAVDTLERGITCANLEMNLSRGEESQPLVLSISLLHGSNGEAEGAILVFNDISRIKALEAERSQTERLAYVGSLAASLAHEIKNPLVTVKTMADLLLERYDDPEFRKDFVALAVQEINRIDVLISQLLGFAREVPVVMQVLDITAPLEDMLLLLSHRLQEDMIDVTKRYPSEPVLVMADGGNLKQVFLNLLLNAVDAMEGRGLLDLTVESCRKRDHEFVRVTIGNQGKPIPEAIRGRIFTPFFTTKPGGTGLGLSICQKIMQQHAGEICLEEDRGDLTRFSIMLPAFSGAPSAEGKQC
jgi:signal transduction histidine kinase